MPVSGPLGPPGLGIGAWSAVGEGQATSTHLCQSPGTLRDPSLAPVAGSGASTPGIGAWAGLVWCPSGEVPQIKRAPATTPYSLPSQVGLGGPPGSAATEQERAHSDEHQRSRDRGDDCERDPTAHGTLLSPVGSRRPTPW